MYLSQYYRFPYSLLVSLFWLPLLPTEMEAQVTTQKFEVVVVSGSSAGVGAALAAGRMGVTVALIEDTPVLGGMLSNGISNIDAYSLESLSGVFEEFRQRVKEYYRPVMSSDPIFGTRMALPRHFDGMSRAANDPDEGGRWEPHVADKIFKEMVAAVPNIKVFYDRYASGVVKQGHRVAGVVTERSKEKHAYGSPEAGSRQVFLAEVVIDASHEADVAAWAGVPYRVGREARSPLEPHAGQIFFFNNTSEIMEGSSGRQDNAIVSYGLRLNIKNYGLPDSRSHLLASPPPGYHKSHYEPSAYSGRPGMPNQKAEMNVHPIGNEMQEVNWVWPDASREERLRLYEAYKNHALGFLYYLQHEKGLTHLGLPRDEFTDNGNLPYRIFVREARRIVGEATVTEADINPFIKGRGLLPPLQETSIAVGHYPIDVKPMKRKVDLSTPDKGDGDFFLVNATTAFQVPYGAIVPRDIEGLLVPAALSATHVAFSAVRMDPTWTVLGQAAGVAAALSAQKKIPARSLPLDQIQRELLRQKCRLMFYWDLPLNHPTFAAVQWLSVQNAASGYPDRHFRPDQGLNRAEMAALIVAALKLWPSVSNLHFNDVGHDHWAFQPIETLFDNQALQAFGIRPRWPEAGPYNPARHGGVDQNQHYFGNFYPSKPVSWKELVATIRSVKQPKSLGSNKEVAIPPPGIDSNPVSWGRQVLSQSEFGKAFAERQFLPEDIVSRGEASALLAALTDSNRSERTVARNLTPEPSFSTDTVPGGR